MVEANVVGGYVRDFLLERNIGQDIDIVAIGSGIELAKQVAKNLQWLHLSLQKL